MAVSWNPWHGCRKISPGCTNCYVYRMDDRHGRNGGEVFRTAAFTLPVRRKRDGAYFIPPGEEVDLCFTSDFLLEDADLWRPGSMENDPVPGRISPSFSLPSGSTASRSASRPIGARGIRTWPLAVRWKTRLWRTSVSQSFSVCQ